MPGQTTFSVPPPMRDLPLAGLTMLAVEDSRYTCDALRILCQRSGARLQRTDTLAGAWRHLAVYRPDVAIIDLGLPDGSGTELIGRLTRGYGGFCGVILAISGDPGGERAAMAAGAAAFLTKPLDRLDRFADTVLLHLARLEPRAAMGATPVRPDRQALRDDLSHAVQLSADDKPVPYVTGFVQSLARASGDMALETLARNAGVTGSVGMARLRRALTDRLERLPPAFAAEPPHLR